LLLIVAIGLAMFAHLFLPAGPFPPKERRVVLVQRGQTLRDVANELERVGLVHGTLGFQVLARLMRLDRSIKAGQYSFRLGTTIPGLLRAFARGMSGLNLVTIPEGLTLREVVDRLSVHLGVPAAAFDSLARDRAFLDSLGIGAPTLEGYLAPDSYEFLPGTSPEVAFRNMARRTEALLLDQTAGRDSLPLSLSLHQILTLASIVESEAQVADERPRIARVYLNRLARGMKLQADPTVAYANGISPRSRVYLRQLHVDSPYNTYLHVGLPPGPICNPGRASIEAAINPSAESSELYFVAAGQGRHLFADTYDQHLAHIREVRAALPAITDSMGVADSTLAAKLAPAPGAVKQAAKDSLRTAVAGQAGKSGPGNAKPDTAHAAARAPARVALGKAKPDTAHAAAKVLARAGGGKAKPDTVHAAAKVLARAGGGKAKPDTVHTAAKAPGRAGGGKAKPDTVHAAKVPARAGLGKAKPDTVHAAAKAPSRAGLGKAKPEMVNAAAKGPARAALGKANLGTVRAATRAPAHAPPGKAKPGTIRAAATPARTAVGKAKPDTVRAAGGKAKQGPARPGAPNSLARPRPGTPGGK